MKKLLLVFLLAGCATVKQDPIPTAVDVPVAIQKFEPSVVEENVEAVIEVKPSTETTYIKVIPKKQSLYKKHLTNEPRIEVQSNNTEITVEQPKRVIWKKWAIFLGFVALMILLAIRWVWDWFKSFSPWGLVKKLLRNKNKE